MIPINEIICGNHINVLSKIQSDCIDLTVTSPPYGKLRSYKGFEFDFKSLAKELYRVTKEGGIVVWVVGDSSVDGSESGESFSQALYFKEIGFNLHDTMIYEKNGFANPSVSRYHQIFEYMFVISKGRIKTFNPLKDRRNIVSRRGGNSKRNIDGSMTIASVSSIPLKKYGLRFNIWKYNIGGSNVSEDSIAFKHPAIFPEQLAKDHILSWSNEGDIILDPMCGSGTTLIAAKKLNRKYIGIDISDIYCDLSRKRVIIGREILEVTELAENLSSKDFADLLI